MNSARFSQSARQRLRRPLQPIETLCGWKDIFSSHDSNTLFHYESSLGRNNGERTINPRERFFFSENLEKMIETRAGVAPGDGEPRRMN